MAVYDPKVLQAFADGLYSYARLVTWALPVLAAVLGGVIGYMLAKDGKLVLIYMVSDANQYAFHGIVVAAVAALPAVFVARVWAFKLRMKAQLMLCQMKIAENTAVTRLSGEDGGGH